MPEGEAKPSYLSYLKPGCWLSLTFSNLPESLSGASPSSSDPRSYTHVGGPIREGRSWPKKRDCVE